LSHELKKKLIAMRNRKLQMIQMHHALHEQSREIAKEGAQQAYEGATKPTNEVDDVVFSAKMQEVRNKLTGRKRMAKERWNRFAGTAAAGARGL
jgi:hypothetical protein